MQVQYDKALAVFKSFKKDITAPGLHPYYIQADAKRNDMLTPKFFVFEESGDFFYHGFHVAGIEDTNIFDIQSPYGYGGPIASSDNEEFISRAWSAYSSWILDNNILVEFARFHPLLNNWRYFNGEIMEDRQTVWIDLSIDEILPTYSSRARTAVRKALKNGLQVEWCDNKRCLEMFPWLYNSAMTELNADQFYFFSSDYFEKLLAWNQAYLSICRLEDKILAAAIFLAEGYIMEYHLSASTSQGKKLGATNLLLHEAISLGQQLGCKLLHLGGGTAPNADNSLLFFKAGFSSKRALFKIGKKIHLEAKYEQMRIEWLSIHGQIPSRILFYR